MTRPFCRLDSQPRALRRALFFVPTIVVALALALSPSWAQQSGLDVSQLGQQFQNIQQNRNSTATATGQGQQPDFSVQTFVPAPRVLPLPASRLEQILSSRAGTKLEQFGYGELGSGRSVAIAQTGAVQDGYVLGPGDQIIVSLRGQENSEFRATVDRGGQVILPRIKPIAASGRSFGSFREDVEAAVHRAYVATDAAVSVATVRQISVMVSGEVNNPGARVLSGLSSVVDALLLSGGVRKTGSLRSIRIQRADHSYTVDLYSVLTSRGNAAQLHLADGDRILVPPLGRTVAVAGLVRQPGIYELPAGQSSLPVSTLLSLAGGQEVRGRYRLSVLRVLDNGQTGMEPLNGDKGVVRDSEILFAQLGADQVTGQATLSGGTGLAGRYSVQSGSRLSDVLRAPGALGMAPYTLFGIIVRRDSRTYLRVPIAFAPVAVLNARTDVALQSDDVIRVLSANEAQMLGFVTRAYLGKLAADQAAARNPVTAEADATAAQAALTGAPGGTPLPADTPALVKLAMDPNSPANLAKQAQKDSQNQFGMDDVSGAPADLQRADVIALMDMAEPGTIWAKQQNDAYFTKLNAPASAAAAATPQFATSGFGESQESIDPSNPQAQLLQNTQTAGTYARPATDTATANFMEQPVGPGGFAGNREVHTFGELARQLNMDPLVLMNFLVDNRARIDGAVAGPGFYFVGPGAGLDDLVQAAGGAANWADQSGVDVMTTAVDQLTGRSATQRQTLPLRQGMLASYMVRPHDQFRFNRVYTDSGLGSVTVQGEVRSAGGYPITRGEHLSDLLARAGGLTPTAYPQGTVYLRKSAAAVERDGYIRAANEIQDQLLVGMTRVGNDKIPPETFAAMQTFITRLRAQKALGRVSFTADPSILAANPDRDPLLEAGDTIYIPQRPSTVSVLGEVMQPGTYGYQAGATLEDYIRKAGGYAQFADDGLTFVVMPDGTARKLDRSWLHFTVDKLPPGSAIVVPRDLTPIDTRQIILDVTGIMSSLAVSLASLAVISR
jgi:protein involved in polysaccharide export with SLBB domain